MVSKTILVGRVGKDPEQFNFDNGSVVSFSLATTEKWTNKEGQKQEETEWHNCKSYGKLADIIMQYVKKGTLLYVEGKNKTRSWDKDGQKHYQTEVVCNQMQMLSSKTAEPQNEFDQMVPPGNKDFRG